MEICGSAEKGTLKFCPHSGNGNRICKVSTAVGQEYFEARVQNLHPICATGLGLTLFVKSKTHVRIK